MTLAETLIAASNQAVFPISTHDVRDERESIESTLSGIPSSPYGASAGRRAIILHDAMASILVSMPNKEVIAVGSTVVDDHLTIFVASNGTSLDNVNEYLREVWDILRKIQNVNNGQRSFSPPSFGIPDTIKYHSELRYFAYKHSIAKFVKRLSKGDALGLPQFFDELLQPASKYVVDQPPEHLQYVLQSELVLIDYLRTIYTSLPPYEFLENAKARNTIADFIMTSCEVFRQQDGFDTRPSSLFSRCDHILQALTPDARNRKPDSFRRFWEKVFSLEHTLQELLRLPYSRRMSRILQLDYTIDIVEQAKVHLQYNLVNDSNIRDIFSGAALTHDEFLDLYRCESPEHLEYDEDVASHCECVLLAHFVNNKITAYGYIGVSKLSCVGCSLYFKAYNKVAEECGSSPFFTRGRHSKGYHQWAKPQLSDHDLDKQIDKAMVRLAKNFLLKATRERRLPGSTDASASSSSPFEATEALKRHGGYIGITEYYKELRESQRSGAKSPGSQDANSED